MQKITKIRTIDELQHDFSDALQVLMNPKTHTIQKKLAAEDIKTIKESLYDAGYSITFTISVRKKQ